MKNFRLIGLIFILFTGFAFLVLAEENKVREWKSFSGKPIVTGTFDKFKPSNPEYVYLRSSNGKLYQYPFSKLSKEDQDFIKALDEDDPDLVEIDETSGKEIAKSSSGARGNDTNSSVENEKQGKKYALLVGVNEYEDKALPPLQYAVADIQLINEKLVEIGFEPENIKMYISGNKVGSYPNKETVEAGLHEILNEAEEGDQVFIAFAGHGFSVDKNSFFVVENTKLDLDNKELMKSTSININKTLEELNNSKASSKWFIVDACREILDQKRSIGKTVSRGISSGIDKTKLPKGVFFLQSCTDGQFSYEDDGHGLFTRCFAEALDGKGDIDHDKNITVLEVFKYVSDTVKKEARNRLGKAQTPTTSMTENTPDFSIVCLDDVIQYGLPNKDWDEVQKLYDEGKELLKQKNKEEALEKFDAAMALTKDANDEAPLKQMLKSVSEDIRDGLKRDKQLEELQRSQEEAKASQLQAENQALLKRIEEIEARTKAAEEAAQRAQEQQKARTTTVVRERPTYRTPTQFVYLGRVRSVPGDNSEARAMAAAYGYRLPSPYELAAISRNDISGVPLDGWIETSDPNTVCAINFQRLVPSAKRGAGQNIVVGCR